MADAKEFQDEVAERRQVNRKKKDYVVEWLRHSVDDEEAGSWMTIDDSPTFDDTLSAKRWAAKNAPDGTYRVIAVCDTFTKRTETIQKTLIE